MAETTAANAGITPIEGGSENQPAGGSQGRTFTQEEVNSMLAKEKRDMQARYAKHDEYKAAYEAQKAMEAAMEELSEKERATSEELAAANERIAGFEAEKQVSEWADQVSRDTGVPASVLKGSTLEELTAHAEQIKAAMPVYPTLPADAGESRAPATTKEELYGIKNREERVMALGQHPELFD